MLAGVDLDLQPANNGRGLHQPPRRRRCRLGYCSCGEAQALFKERRCKILPMTDIYNMR